MVVAEFRGHSRLMVPRAIDVFDSIKRASRDEIQALQRTRLATSLAHAYTVPHTRAAWDAARVHPSDFRDLPKLARFPFMTKARFRVTYPFGLLAVPLNQSCRKALTPRTYPSRCRR